MSEVKIVKRIASYYARPASYSTGGVNTSRQHWMLSLAEAGMDVVVLNAAGGFTRELVKHERVEFRSLRHWGTRRISMIPRKLREALAGCDLVYLHEGWTASNIYAAAVCRSLGVPYVIMPHGVYAEKIVPTLKMHRLRRVFESRMAEKAATVHLFFAGEVAELKAVAPKSTAVVVATGFSLPRVEWEPSQTDRYIAWVGRFDILHKGIDRLLAGLSLIPEASRPRLRMCGPDYQGDKERVSQLVKRLGLSRWVEINAELPPDDVLEFIRRSQGFVHVPRWEAFGRTIAEALSMGVPVVLGNGAQMASSLADEGAAIVVDGDSEAAIASGLEALWSGEPTEGPAGRDWVQNNLEWKTRVTLLAKEMKNYDLDLTGVDI